MHLHSVGMDEAHEMCINKESKGSITKPTNDNMERLVHYFPYRSKAIKNLKDQLRIKTKVVPKVHSMQSHTHTNRVLSHLQFS